MIVSLYLSLLGTVLGSQQFLSCALSNNISENIKWDFRIDTNFYKKIAFANDLPVVSSAEVSDMALMKACKIIEFMLADRQGVRDRLLRKNAKFAVVGKNEVITDIPEYSHLSAWYNQRARGIGGTDNIRLTVSSEENLLCLAQDPYHEDIYVHEVAHGVHLVGATRGFKRAVQQAYRHAKQNNLWGNTYARYDYREYFAESVQSFFNHDDAQIEAPGPENGNGIQNNIDTRKKLFKYDRVLFNLIHQLFPCANWMPDRCSILQAASTPEEYSEQFDREVHRLGFRQNCQYNRMIQLKPYGRKISTIND